MTPLRFTEHSFEAVIVLNGDLPDLTVLEQLADVPFVAADGAANTLVALGVMPEYVVGDLDSISVETLRHIDAMAEIVVEPDQDSNDFEKSLRFAQSQLWRRLLVLGLHGGDLEHTLNNWSVLMRYGQQLSLCAYDRGRYAIPMFSSFLHTPNAQELLSLIPQPMARLTTRGLQWELQDEPLQLGAREGARNRAGADDVHVTIHDGSLLFICDARLPAAPSFGQSTTGG
jgi:thiamine pyrophosphokinase